MIDSMGLEFQKKTDKEAFSQEELHRNVNRGTYT